MDDIARLRNVAIVGPHHAGKTTLVEALLAHCGAIPRRGSVRDGTTITDCEPEAIGHLQSVCVGFAHASCGPVDVNIVDTPGFVDFFEETKTALTAVDAAVIVIDAEPDRVAQTAGIVEHLEMRKTPHLFFVNKLDKPGANFDATLAALREAYGPHVVATQLPVGIGEKFSGYVDLATRKAYLNADGRTSEIAIPIGQRDAVETQRTILLEALADFDDTLMEELLDGKDPAQDEIDRDLCEDCAHDQIIPVLVGSAQENIGVAPLVDAVARLFPSPATEPRKDVDGRPVVPRADGPVVAQVCKTIVHPQQGKLSVVRVFTGTLTPSTPLVDASRGNAAVRLSGIARLFGKNQEPVTSAGPGSIVALARLDGVCTGDTLSSPNAGVLMPTVPLAEPLFAVAIAPAQRLDEAKLSQALARLIDEDPALRVGRAEFTNELQLLGSGETHVVDGDRAARAQVQRRRQDAPAVDRVPRDDPDRHRDPLALQAPDRRPRPVRRREAALRAARARQRRVVRGEDRRRRRAAAVLPGGREGRARSARHRRAARLPGDRHPRDAVRRRVPRRRLERSVVQDGVGDGRARRAAQARHGGARAADARRDDGAVGVPVGSCVAAHREARPDPRLRRRRQAGLGPHRRARAASRARRATRPSCAPPARASARTRARHERFEVAPERAVVAHA